VEPTIRYKKQTGINNNCKSTLGTSLREVQHRSQEKKETKFQSSPNSLSCLRLPAENVQMTASTPNYTPVLPKGTKVSSFVNSRSQKIHTIQLDPSVDNNGEQQPTATVFFLHGICDHSGRSGYCEFYERLAAQNCRVFAMDHHGHGQSEGSPRCYCERFEDYVLDYQEFVEANWKDGDPPIFLAGHSLGGLMAIFLCVQLGDRVNGMILSAPACGVELDFNKKAQLFLSPVLDCLCPQAKVPISFFLSEV